MSENKTKCPKVQDLMPTTQKQKSNHNQFLPFYIFYHWIRQREASNHCNQEPETIELGLGFSWKWPKQLFFSQSTHFSSTHTQSQPQHSYEIYFLTEWLSEGGAIRRMCSFDQISQTELAVDVTIANPRWQCNMYFFFIWHTILLQLF